MIFAIPMAGNGLRFKMEGYTQPKMLLTAHGKTLLEWSVDSLPLKLCTKLVFIGLQEHEDQFSICQFIKEKYASRVLEIQFKFLKNTTRGQSETVLAGLSKDDFDIPLLIFNIDTRFSSSTLEGALIKNKDTGYLGSFKELTPHFSFARTDKNGFVIEVAEKVAISNNALTGLYHFAKTKHFFEAATDAIQENETQKGEFYVAPLYNRLIKKGLKFKLDICNECDVIGTPNELEQFKKKIFQ